MKKLVRFLGLLGLTLCIAMPASASTFWAMDQAQLVAGSDAIVEGKVVDVESFWDREGRVIVTMATVRVDDALLGKVNRTIQVQTFGGTVGDYTVEAAGFPKFNRGDHVLLFLNQRDALDKSTRVTGYQQGHYRIAERGGEKVAVPTVDAGANLIRQDGLKVVTPGTMPLHDLREQIGNTIDELARASR
jgi:type IV secretory pathway protease TraF